MEIRYFGWSGLTIQHQNLRIGFDLFGDAVNWRDLPTALTTILCVTHGHPEHCGSLRQFLHSPDGVSHRPNTHVVSSTPVIQYLTRAASPSPEHYYCVENAASLHIAEAELSAFKWTHMPLLPPGMLPKAGYLAHLAAHPVDLLQIGLSGLSLPANAPTLGFYIRFPDGRTVLNYAEGLHRLSDPAEVQAVAGQFPAEILAFAVEPDDIDAIPHWVEILHPSTVILYEAHRPWRDLFGLPYLDLKRFAETLSEHFPAMAIMGLTDVGQHITLD